jgi:hypothetical protein
LPILKLARARGFALAACCASASFWFLPMLVSAQASLPSENGPNVSMSPDPAPEMMETGFRNLYELNFKGAREKFLAYQKMAPNDPLGRAAEAASYLYEEFNEKGVLTSDFFLNDQKLLGGADGSSAENRNGPFLDANQSARLMAKQQLKGSPRDPRALLVLTMTDGMESDYDALIIKKQVAGIGLMKQAEAEAGELLAVDPNQQDAYLALGASNYIIGCLPGYKKAFLWIGGVHGDKAKGLEEMESVAQNGHYLRPFAKILLALAYEREHQMEKARALLADLANQFPTNPIYAHELSLLNKNSARDRAGAY